MGATGAVKRAKATTIGPQPPGGERIQHIARLRLTWTLEYLPAAFWCARISVALGGAARKGFRFAFAIHSLQPNLKDRHQTSSDVHRR